MRNQTMSRETASYCLSQFSSAVKRHEKKQRRKRWNKRISAIKSFFTQEIVSSKVKEVLFIT